MTVNCVLVCRAHISAINQRRNTLECMFQSRREKGRKCSFLRLQDSHKIVGKLVRLFCCLQWANPGLPSVSYNYRGRVCVCVPVASPGENPYVTGFTASRLFIIGITFLPVKTLIGVISKGERWDDQLTGHGAQLFAESLHILTDSLVSKQLCNKERCYLDINHCGKNSKGGKS